MNDGRSFDPVNLSDRLQAAFRKSADDLLSDRNSSGHWVGQLSTSALSTATAVSALSAIRTHCQPADYSQSISRERLDDLIQAGVDWLVTNQRQDGGWGDTLKSYSNISTTMLAIAALHFSGRAKEYSEKIEKAQGYVDRQGGIEGLKARYGVDKTFAVPILANCALAGIVEWKSVAPLPFEAACVPQRIYHWMKMPVVSYAIPALVAIGQAKYHFDPPWNPFTRVMRMLSVRRSLRVLKNMQPSSGGFLEAIPLTSFVTMALASIGRVNHSVVQNGLRFIVESVLDDGSWPIDTNLATWTTTLSVNALAGGLPQGPGYDSGNRELDRSCLSWILECQNQTVHPFTNSPPGGWGWTDLAGAVPDADDTPGALLALQNFYQRLDLDVSEKERIRNAAIMGVDWLLKLQNRDKGWPTFCRGWGRLPFDRSGADITAHCLRGIHSWKTVYPDSARVSGAIQKGMVYLEENQQQDGSWLPLWFGNQDMPDDINPIYGTAKVLAAFVDLDMARLPGAVRGFGWLAENQNRDGSWGGGESGPFAKPGAGDGISSGSIEETSLAVEALMQDPDVRHQESISRGLTWLIERVENNESDRAWPIGFYFAKLWYYEKLYPKIFLVSALKNASILARKRPRIGE